MVSGLCQGEGSAGGTHLTHPKRLTRPLQAALALLLPALAVRAHVIPAPVPPPVVISEATCPLHLRVVPQYQASPRALAVDMAFDPQGREETVLRVANGWAGVTDFGRALKDWRGLSAGTQVEALPPGPGADASVQRWRVRHPAQGRVRLAYQAQAALADPQDGQVQDASQLYRTQLGPDWFQFFGYGVFPSLEPWGDDSTQAMCLSVAQAGPAPVLGSHFAPTTAQVVAPAPATLPAAPAVFETQRRIVGSPQLLRHAFYAGGSGWRVLERPLPGGPLHLALRGQYQGEDATLADAAAQLIGTHRRFWGADAFEPQWLVVTPNFSNGNNSGTVVHQAAALHVPASFGPRSGNFEFLVGHENLHHWLPARLGLRQGHGELPPYWLSEGFTNYYTHRLLLSSGLWNLDRYAQALTADLQAYWRSPARNASAASIAPRFFSDRDAGRQMYARGELLAMRWDAALRAKDQPAGLDGILRGLVQAREPVTATTSATSPTTTSATSPTTTSPTPPATATVRVMAALRPLLGPQPEADLQAYIERGEDLPLPADLAGPCFQLGWVDQPRWVLGFDPAASFPRYQAVGVVPDGPAHRAGLREGMALAGWSVFGNDTAREVELQVKVDDQVRELRYRPVDGSSDRLPQLATRPGAAEDTQCRRWMRR